MKLKSFFAINLLALWVLSEAALAAQAAKPGFDEKAVANFYQGKTVRIVVGFSAGMVTIHDMAELRFLSGIDDEPGGGTDGL